MPKKSTKKKKIDELNGREGILEGLSDSQKKMIGSILIISLITSFSLIAASFERVNYDEYGIKRNWFTGIVEYDTEPLEPGLYYVGLTYDIILFPSTIQTVDFSTQNPIRGTSKSGSPILIECSYQYLLIKNELNLLLKTFGTNYEDTLTKLSRDSLRNIMTEFNTAEFYENRSSISDAMQNALAQEFLDKYVQIYDFQLRAIDFTPEIDAAIALIEQQKLDQELAKQEYISAQIRAETALLEAYAKANVTLVDSQTEAERLLIETNATAAALNISMTAEAETLLFLSESLGLNSTQILQYLWIQAILEHDSAYLIIGEDTPVLLTNDVNSTG